MPKIQEVIAVEELKVKAPGVIGIVLLVSAGFVMPASANWFSNPYLGINRNIGSAPNPTPEQIRQERLGEHGLFVYNRSATNDVSPPPALSQTQPGPSDQTSQNQNQDMSAQANAQTAKSMADDAPFGPL